MKYLSAYYRAQGGNVTTSLVLQQMQDEKSGCPMLFGCLCAQDAIAEELLGWLGRKKPSSLQRIAQTLDEWGKEVEKFLERWVRIQSEREEALGGEAGSAALTTLSSCDVSGILCLDNEFLIFYSGAALFYIINTRFGRNHVKAVELTATQGIIRGSLEHGVGILLPNHNFMNGITERQLQESLNVQELKVEAQLECRLRELGRLGERHDILESERWNEEKNESQGSAAIFMVTQ